MKKYAAFLSSPVLDKINRDPSVSQEFKEISSIVSSIIHLYVTENATYFPLAGKRLGLKNAIRLYVRKQTISDTRWIREIITLIEEAVEKITAQEIREVQRKYLFLIVRFLNTGIAHRLLEPLMKALVAIVLERYVGKVISFSPDSLKNVA